MELQEFIKSHFAQDLSHWLIILFVCFLLPVFAALFDLWTGVDAAKANKERISSHALRRTVSKIVDYLRVIIFGLFIDVLGLFFSWYLLHFPVIATFSSAFLLALYGQLNYHLLMGLNLVLTTAIVWALSTLMTRYVEEPYNRFLARW